MVLAAPVVVAGQRQAAGQQNAVGRLGQPAPQVRIGVEKLLLMQGVFVVAGDMQGLDQQAAVFHQQAVALDDPLRHAPVRCQGQAQ